MLAERAGRPGISKTARSDTPDCSTTAVDLGEYRLVSRERIRHLPLQAPPFDLCRVSRRGRACKLNLNLATRGT
jgi:hypothetical protein